VRSKEGFAQATKDELHEDHFGLSGIGIVGNLTKGRNLRTERFNRKATSL
jgi:hypothetical protein